MASTVPLLKPEKGTHMHTYMHTWIHGKVGITDLDEHRYKNSQQNISKPNPVIHVKGSWHKNRTYPENGLVLQHIQINKHNMSHQHNEKYYPQDHLNRYRKVFLKQCFFMRKKPLTN